MILIQKPWIKVVLLVLIIVGSITMTRRDFTPQVLASPNCTIAAGVIASNTTWSPGACSTYDVTGNISVLNGVTLTIEPGTTIQFANNTSLTVQGVLLAMGTANNPITFTSSNGSPLPGDWLGILFVDEAPDAIVNLSYNYISGSIIQHSIIEYAQDGINLRNSIPYIDSNMIRNNFQGIDASSSYSSNPTPLVIRNSTISFNGDDTVSFGYSGGGISVSGGLTYIAFNTISHNYSSPTGITSNGGGISAGFGDCIITENVIAYNQAGNFNYGYSRGGGIYSACDLTLTNNIISHNVVNNYQGHGGALFVNAGTIQSMQGNLIMENEADYGGAISFTDYNFEGEITNNTVINNVAQSGGGGIIINRNSDTNVVTFRHNNLYGNTANGQPNDFTNADPSYQPPNIDLTYNWWGTTDSATIESHVYHYIDDVNLGLLLYTPFLMEAGASQGSIDTGGGTFTSSDGLIELVFPPNAVNESVTVYYSHQFTPTTTLPNNAQFVLGFNLRAIKADGTAVTQFTQPLTLTINYPSDAELSTWGIDETTLTLSYWDGAQWQSAYPCAGCSVNTNLNQIAVQLDHFTEFALVAESSQIFLPAIIR